MFDPAVPSIGTVRAYQGQEFHCVGWKRHTRKDGIETTLVRWEMACADCGKPTDFLISAKAVWAPTRRCLAHRRPGSRVKLRAMRKAKPAGVLG